MKRPPQIALVCAGAISRTSLTKLPVLIDSLGPVLSSSRRIASRAVNALGAGWPISHFEELSTARTVIISVPDCELDATVRCLEQVKFAWNRRAVVLSNSLRDSAALEPLRLAGAAVGSFHEVDALNRSLFVIEGESAALSAMRVLLGVSSARSIQIHRGARQLYVSAITSATLGIAPALLAASQSLQGAGIKTKQADTLVKALAHRAVDAFDRTKKRG